LSPLSLLVPVILKKDHRNKRFNCTSCSLNRLKLNEFKCVGCAFTDTGGFESLIQSIHAHITLHSLAVIRVLYRNVPWTCGFARHAAYTFFLVNIDNTVSPLDHGIRRTHRYAERILTVSAGGKGDFKARDTTNLLERSGAYIAEKWPHG